MVKQQPGARDDKVGMKDMLLYVYLFELTVKELPQSR